MGIGYITRRKDGITELRINGYERTKEILDKMYPYVKFKKKQIGYVLEILSILSTERKLFKLDKSRRKRMARLILDSRNETYQSGLKSKIKLKSDLKKIMNI